MYEEAQGRLEAHTEEGLRARVFYRYNVEPEFRVYPQGDVKFGLVAFYVYMTHLIGFEKPVVKQVGNVSQLSNN